MRIEKKAIVEEITGQLKESDFVLLANYQGLTVRQLSELRARARGSACEFHVVKNSFFGQAAKEMGWSGLDDLLQGPTGMLVGTGDVAAAAKLLKDYARTNEKLLLKGGVLESEVLGESDVKALADMPARPVMLSIAVGTIAAPMVQLVGVMNQKVLSLLYALKAVEAKKEAE